MSIGPIYFGLIPIYLNFIDSKVILLLLIPVFFLNTLLCIFNEKRKRKYPKKKEKSYVLINEDPQSDFFHKVIKSFFLYDKEYFKNTPRNHFLVVQAFGISLNSSFLIVLFYWLSSKFLYSHLNSTIPDADFLIKASTFFVTSTLAIYWNLKNDQNKKFDYCLATYNDILKDKILEKDGVALREACLAMDILTMDLWSKRILSPFFIRILSRATNSDIFTGKLTHQEVYIILKDHAKKELDLIEKTNRDSG